MNSKRSSFSLGGVHANGKRKRTSGSLSSAEPNPRGGPHDLAPSALAALAKQRPSTPSVKNSAPFKAPAMKASGDSGSSGKGASAQNSASVVGGRFDNSLGQLTQKFLCQVRESPTGVVDLNEAAGLLGVPKRRIYDITNVLEGIGVLEKESKNKIVWKDTRGVESIASDATQEGGSSTNRDASPSPGSGAAGAARENTPERGERAPDGEDKADAKLDELSKLRMQLQEISEEEAEVDRKIQAVQRELLQYTTGAKDSNLAYVTHEDVRNIPEFHAQTVIAIKAPVGTELSIPDPNDTAPNGRKRYEIFLKSSGGPIDCVLIKDAELPPTGPGLDLNAPTMFDCDENHGWLFQDAAAVHFPTADGESIDYLKLASPGAGSALPGLSSSGAIPTTGGYLASPLGGVTPLRDEDTGYFVDYADPDDDRGLADLFVTSSGATSQSVQQPQHVSSPIS